MNPFALFMLAIFSPMLLFVALTGPIYAGILGASYAIYYKSGAAAHPLDDKLFDVFYIIDVYVKLFKQWSSHIVDASFLTYTLPLLLLPAIGIILSLGMTSRISRKLQDIFQLGVGR
jgi:hypothetical protein